MKKILSIILTCAVLFTVTIPACATRTTAVSVSSAQITSAVKLNTTKKTLVKGQTYTLKVTGTSSTVKWSTSNKKIASVSSKGKVTAIAKGTATITAKVSGKKYTCKVSVETPKINKTSITLTESNTYGLKISGTTQKVSWTSSSASVASVSQKGVVTARKKGTATITAKLTSGKKYSCKVTVKSATVSLNNITATNYNITGNKGVVSVVTNKNSVPVDLTVTVLYYDKFGNLIDSVKKENYCLESNRTCALKIIAPFNKNTWEDIDYNSYKVKLSVEKTTNMVLGAKYISLDINNSPSTAMLVVGATNTGSKNLYTVQIAAVFFDENGDCIGYDYAYPDCKKAGSTDYVNLDYPYNRNYDSIPPASYKVYVNHAYNYTWMS